MRNFKITAIALISLIGLLSASLISHDRPSISPIEKKDNPKVISEYGKRIHPILDVEKMHLGVDIVADVNASVVATANGIVIEVMKLDTGYGNAVIIEHKEGLKTLYAHLNKVLVTEGEMIRISQKVGTVGNTGASTHSHLHYEVIKNQTNVNPLDYFSMK